MSQAEKDAVRSDSARDFVRGFYCAVAILLVEGHEQQARAIFKQGGNPLLADDSDIEVLRRYGLLVENGGGQLVSAEAIPQGGDHHLSRAALLDECRRLKCRGLPVQAEKLYRSEVGCGLRDAHEVIRNL